MSSKLAGFDMKTWQPWHCRRGFLSSAETGKESTDSITAERKIYSPISNLQHFSSVCFIRYILDKMMGRHNVLILFAFLVEGVFGDEVKSVKEGDPVILHSGVIKKPDDMMRWYFNDRLIALINGDPKETCLYDGPGGRFKDRLMLDANTASLIITNSTAEHTGRYEAKFKQGDTSGTTEKFNRTLQCDTTKIITKYSNPDKTIKSFSLTVSASDFGKNNNEAQIDPQDKEKKTVPGSCLSPAVVAGIVFGVVGVLLLAAAVVVVGVMIFRRRSSRDDMKKIEQESDEESSLQNGKA